MRVKRLLFILVALMMTLATMLSFSSAFAGVDRNEIVNVESETNWKLTASENISLNTDMRFTSQTTKNATAVINRNLDADPDEGVPYFARIVSAITVNQFTSDGGYFSYNFGLRNSNAKIGGQGYGGNQQLEVYLSPASTTGKIKVAARYVGGADLVSLDNAAIVQAEATFEVAITAEANPVLQITYGDNAMITTTLSAYPKGYIGIGQNNVSGTNIVTISEFSMYTYNYRRPNNYEFTEDFDYGDKLQYDSRLIYSRSEVGIVTPSYLAVNEDPVTHNRYLRFNNCGWSFFATKEQYSNFEMTFDMFDVPQATFTKNIGEGGVDENGDGVPDVLANGQIVISLGIVNEPSSIKSYSTGAKLSMYVGWSRVTGNREIMIRDGNYHYFGYDSDHNPRIAYFVQDTPYALDGTTHCNPFELGNMKVKISAIDGIFSVWYVPYADYVTAGDDVWNQIDPVLSYDMGYTPLGRVMFAIQGSDAAPTDGNYAKAQSSNASIDNIQVVNRDINPNSTLITRDGFVTNLLPERAETYYKYEDFYNDNDLLGARIESGAINNSFLAALFDFSNLTTVEIIILVASAVLIVGTVVTVVLVIVKKGKTPTAPADEETVSEDAEPAETAETETAENTAEAEPEKPAEAKKPRKKKTDTEGE